MGDERRKLPKLIIFFLVSSFMDVIGLGMIGIYLKLIFNPNAQIEGQIYNLFAALNISVDQQILPILLGVTLLLVFLMKMIVIVLINYRILDFSFDQEIRLKSTLMQTFQNQPYIKFTKRNSAEYIHAIQSYTGSFATSIQTLLRMISESLVGLAVIIVLALTNFIILLVLLILLGCVVFSYFQIFEKKLKKYGTEIHVGARMMLKGTQEGMTGFKEIRILGREKYFYQMVHNGAKIHARNQIGIRIHSILPRYSLEFLLVAFIISLATILQLFEQDLQNMIPTLGIFATASLRLLPSASNISRGMVELRVTRFGVSQLYKELSAIKEESDKQKIALRNSYNGIEVFKNFSIRGLFFTYPNAKMRALSNIQMNIVSGESIGLIGPSGSGKTTMVDILLGLLEPQQGELYFNGRPLKTSIMEWHSQVAYLPQEIFLIDSSLKHNIALGIDVNEIDKIRLSTSIKQARLDELVEELPNGIDTILGERGIRLSGGQRQRVALARSFYHERNVLIMDEATSALDYETEREIVEEIKHLKGKKTLIVIAHRLTTVQHCNRIYRIEKGRIVEQGSYDEVVNSKNKNSEGG